MSDVNKPPTYEDLQNRFERGAYERALKAMIKESAHTEADSIRILDNLGRMGWRLVKE